MNRHYHLCHPADLGLLPSFGLRTSYFGPVLKILLPVVVLSLALHPASLQACAACYGQSDSPMAAGMNWGIFSLLVVILTVLGGVASFFIYLARRSVRTPLVASEGVASQYGRGPVLLARAEVHKLAVAGGVQSVAPIGHRCARGKAPSNRVAFSDGKRRIVPGSAPLSL